MQKSEFFRQHFRTPDITSILYIFLLAICAAYGVLIFYSAEFIGYEGSNILAQKPISPRETKMKEMTKGYPVEKMSKYISQKDRKTAAFLLGIAKKESNWGKFSPQKDGRDCYNYWGYRGTYNQTDSGYSCFDTPGQAVGVVGKRMSDLIGKGVDSPREMAVWKCGWDEDCQRTPEAKKWIVDVGYYAQKF